MKTTTWNYDFSSLPRWDNHEKFPYAFDKFYEIPESDALCCIYSVIEVRMCDERGFLAILKNKEAPHLIVNIADEAMFRPNVSVSADGKLLLLFCPSRQEIWIIDLQKEAFARYAPIGEPWYGVEQINADSFLVIKPLRKTRKLFVRQKRIRLSKLSWTPITELSSRLKPAQ